MYWFSEKNGGEASEGVYGPFRPTEVREIIVILLIII